jgi:glycosyltransferase involved in cell wall biosynthesis
MRIALIAPPFIPVPPPRYGGTELFIENLALGLKLCGMEPVLYANGQSHLPGIETRAMYPRIDWPIQNGMQASLKDLNHSSWACQTALRDCDIVHLHNAPGLVFSRFPAMPPVVYTLHHPWDGVLAEFYSHFPDVGFTAISAAQARAAAAALPELEIIHHGLDLGAYTLGAGKRDYLAVLGRIAPIKGVEPAIEAALRCGIPLKLAGEIQPIFRDYWEAKIKPRVDGRNIEYVGELDLAGKNELLGGARTLLFPVLWDEPFGLVMIEAMACGAPVLAFPRGSAPEVVRDGVSGWLCPSLAAMAQRARAPLPSPDSCRNWVERNFEYRQMARRYAAYYTRRIALRQPAAIRMRGSILAEPPLTAA